MHTLTLPHLPYEVHIALFRNVQNVNYLRTQVAAANPDFDYAFVDAGVIISTFQLLSAVHKALHNHNNNLLRTKNIHSEIVFALSPNNNIAKAYTNFGISATSRHLFVIKVASGLHHSHEAVAAHLRAVVEGEELEVRDEVLRETVEIGRLLKEYRLKAGLLPKLAGRAEVDGVEQGVLERAVCAAMVIKYVG